MTAPGHLEFIKSQQPITARVRVRSNAFNYFHIKAFGQQPSVEKSVTLQIGQTFREIERFQEYDFHKIIEVLRSS